MAPPSTPTAHLPLPMVSDARRTHTPIGIKFPVFTSKLIKVSIRTQDKLNYFGKEEHFRRYPFKLISFFMSKEHENRSMVFFFSFCFL